GGVAQRSKFKYARDRQPCGHSWMIQEECCEMPTGRPTRQYDGPRNTMSAGLRGEPVKCGSQLFGDLCQARVRGESVARQRRRPATRENALGHASKYLLAAALPIAAMDMNVARCLRIGSRIQIPFGPTSLSISQIEVLRTLRAE